MVQQRRNRTGVPDLQLVAGIDLRLEAPIRLTDVVQRRERAEACDILLAQRPSRRCLKRVAPRGEHHVGRRTDIEAMVD